MSDEFGRDVPFVDCQGEHGDEPVETLRDKFAMAVAPDLIARLGIRYAAKSAYEFADLMLIERKK